MTDGERRRLAGIERERVIMTEKYYVFGRLHEPSLVLDNFLFLGNFDHASDGNLLERFNIRNIINVCDLYLPPRITEQFNVVHIPMLDSTDADIKKHFDRTNALLRDIYARGERCLVHCAAGVSRSATIVLAYLMKYHHNTLNDAFYFLIQKRPQISPNEGFMVQLMRYESELIRSRELSRYDQSIESLRRQDNPFLTFDEYANTYRRLH